MQLILYSKPGCHLCEGLQEKLAQITTLNFDLEVRDITQREDWFAAYQYEIPVLLMVRSPRTNEADPPDSPALIERLPRLSPRATVAQLEQMLQKYLTISDSE